MLNDVISVSVPGGITQNKSPVRNPSVTRTLRSDCQFTSRSESPNIRMACKKKTKLWESVTEDKLQTTTQAMLEESAKGLKAITAQRKKLVNFQSFSMDE